MKILKRLFLAFLISGVIFYVPNNFAMKKRKQKKNRKKNNKNKNNNNFSRKNNKKNSPKNSKKKINNKILLSSFLNDLPNIRRILKQNKQGKEFVESKIKRITVNTNKGNEKNKINKKKFTALLFLLKDFKINSSRDLSLLQLFISRLNSQRTVNDSIINSLLLEFFDDCVTNYDTKSADIVLQKASFFIDPSFFINSAKKLPLKENTSSDIEMLIFLFKKYDIFLAERGEKDKGKLLNSAKNVFGRNVLNEYSSDLKKLKDLLFLYVVNIFSNKIIDNINIILNKDLESLKNIISTFDSQSKCFQGEEYSKVVAIPNRFFLSSYFLLKILKEEGLIKKKPETFKFLCSSIIESIGIIDAKVFYKLKKNNDINLINNYLIKSVSLFDKGISIRAQSAVKFGNSNFFSYMMMFFIVEMIKSPYVLDELIIEHFLNPLLTISFKNKFKTKDKQSDLLSFNFNVRSLTEENILSFAIKSKRPILVEYLLKKKIKKTINYLDEETEKIEEIDLINTDNNTLLHLALQSNCRSIIRSLMREFQEENRLDKLINSRNNNYLTCLHYAVFNKDLVVAKALISFGANPFIDYKKGITPFEILCKTKKFEKESEEKERVELIQDLILLALESKELIDYLIKNKFSEYMNSAIRENNLELISILLSAGADILNKDNSKSGFTPLHEALLKNNKKTLDLLISKLEIEKKEAKDLDLFNKKINVKDNEGYTVLMTANYCFNKYEDTDDSIIARLINLGVDSSIVCGIDGDENTILHSFSESKKRVSLKVFKLALYNYLKNKGDLYFEVGGLRFSSPLCLALLSGNFDFAEIILDEMISNKIKISFSDIAAMLVNYEKIFKKHEYLNNSLKEEEIRSRLVKNSIFSSYEELEKKTDNILKKMFNLSWDGSINKLLLASFENRFLMLTLYKSSDFFYEKYCGFFSGTSESYCSFSGSEDETDNESEGLLERLNNLNLNEKNVAIELSKESSEQMSSELEEKAPLIYKEKKNKTKKRVRKSAPIILKTKNKYSSNENFIVYKNKAKKRYYLLKKYQNKARSIPSYDLSFFVNQKGNKDYFKEDQVNSHAYNINLRDYILKFGELKVAPLSEYIYENNNQKIKFDGRFTKNEREIKKYLFKDENINKNLLNNYECKIFGKIFTKKEKDQILEFLRGFRKDFDVFQIYGWEKNGHLLITHDFFIEGFYN